MGMCKWIACAAASLTEHRISSHYRQRAEAVRAESHTDTAQTWPPQKTQNMVADDNIQRRIHAFYIMQAATDADLTSH